MLQGGPLSITEQQQAGNPCVYYGNTSIHPEVFSFHAEFLDKFNFMENIFLFLFWPYQMHPLPVDEGLD